MGSKASDGQTELVVRAFGALSGIPFAATAHILYQDLLFSGVLFVAEGIAMYYLLTYVFAKNEELNGHASPGGIHEGALGFGLSMGAVSMLAGTFADVEIPVAIAAGLLVAAVAYVVLSVALPPVEQDRSAL